MRLICPRCNAQYEVPKEAMPPQGRDVQCSACNTTWFQYHPEHIPQPEAQDAEAIVAEPEVSAHLEAEGETAVMTKPAQTEQASEAIAEETAEAPRKELDPEILDILRQEAQRESEVRSQEAKERKRQNDLKAQLEARKHQSAFKKIPESILETPEQPEEKQVIHKSSPPAPPEKPQKQIRKLLKRIETLRGSDVKVGSSHGGHSLHKDHAQKTGRDLLPDIEEISSTLRSTNERRMFEILSTRPPASKKRRKSRRRAFRGSILIMAALVALYIFAPTIGTLIPQAHPYLETYVSFVNQQRNTLDHQLRSTAMWLNNTASNQNDT